MDMLKIGAGVVLVAAFAGALMVRNTPVETVAAAQLPAICGEVHADHAGMASATPMAGMDASLDEAHQALMDTMVPMHSDMMRGMMAEDFEIAFVCGMIPHHKGAVDMAQVALKYGSDPWITMFAQEIVMSQQQEIAEMQAYLARKQLPQD